MLYRQILNFIEIHRTTIKIAIKSLSLTSFFHAHSINSGNVISTLCLIFAIPYTLLFLLISFSFTNIVTLLPATLTTKPLTPSLRNSCCICVGVLALVLYLYRWYTVLSSCIVQYFHKSICVLFQLALVL